MERAVDSWIVQFSSHDKWCECCWFCSPSFCSLLLLLLRRTELFFFFIVLSRNCLSFSCLNDENSDFPLLTWKSVNIVIIDRKHFPQQRKNFHRQSKNIEFCFYNVTNTHRAREREQKKSYLEFGISLYWYIVYFFFAPWLKFGLQMFSLLAWCAMLCSYAMNSCMYVSGKNCSQSLTSKQKVFSTAEKTKRECCDKLGRFLYFCVYFYWRCGGIILQMFANLQWNGFTFLRK